MLALPSRYVVHVRGFYPKAHALLQKSDLVISKLSSPHGQVYGRCTRAKHFQKSVTMCKVPVVVKAGLTVCLLPSLTKSTVGRLSCQWLCWLSNVRRETLYCRAVVGFGPVKAFLLPYSGSLRIMLYHYPSYLTIS